MYLTAAKAKFSKIESFSEFTIPLNGKKSFVLIREKELIGLPDEHILRQKDGNVKDGEGFLEDENYKMIDLFYR